MHATDYLHNIITTNTETLELTRAAQIYSIKPKTLGYRGVMVRIRRCTACTLLRVFTVYLPKKKVIYVKIVFMLRFFM